MPECMLGYVAVRLKSKHIHEEFLNNKQYPHPITAAECRVVQMVEYDSNHPVEVAGSIPATASKRNHSRDLISDKRQRHRTEQPQPITAVVKGNAARRL